MTTAGRSVRVLTAVTLLLTNALPLEIGNLTPSSEKRERILFCLPQMNVRSERDTLLKIRAKTAEAVAEGFAKLRELYGAQFSQVFRTITCDNGSEFARLQEAVPEAKVYYAHPYAPWERGTNEKQNALVRYFIPKGMDMTNLSEEEVQRVEDWINTLPRKILGYETPQERFDAALKNLRP